MKLKEFIDSTAGKSVSSTIGSSRFRTTLDKEALKTPHFRMDRVLQMMEDDTAVSSGLNQLILFLISNAKFKSKDANTVKFANEWIRLRPNIADDLHNFAMLWAGCGNGYLEPVYASRGTNNEKKFDNIICFNDPSVMYINIDRKSDDEYWLVQVPMDVRMQDGKTPEMCSVFYASGTQLQRFWIWAIKYPKTKFKHYTLGWNRGGMYGSGLLSSAIDNDDIKREILKNWALVAKFRAMGKKVFGFYTENGESIDPNEIEDIRQQFSALQEEESLILNRKFDSADLTFTGQDNTMDAQIEYLHKSTGSALTPNFMTAFSQDSSLATATEAKIPFSLQLKSLQARLIVILNDAVVKPLIESYSFLSKDLSFELETPELYSRFDQFQLVAQLYNSRAATMNEMRKAAGLAPVQNGDKWPTDVPLDKMTAKVEDTAPLEANELAKTKNKESFVNALTELAPKTKIERVVNREFTKKWSEIAKPSEMLTTEDKQKAFAEAAKQVLTR